MSYTPPKTPERNFSLLDNSSFYCETPKNIEKDNHLLNDSNLSYSVKSPPYEFPYSPVQELSPIKIQSLSERVSRKLIQEKEFLFEKTNTSAYSQLVNMISDHISGGLNVEEFSYDYTICDKRDFQKNNYSLHKFGSSTQEEIPLDETFFFLFIPTGMTFPASKEKFSLEDEGATKYISVNALAFLSGFCKTKNNIGFVISYYSVLVKKVLK